MAGKSSLHNAAVDGYKPVKMQSMEKSIGKSGGRQCENSEIRNPARS